MSMRGASGEAMVALGDQLATVAAADLAQFGEDLFGVAAVLRSEPGLRRVATDLSTDAAAKAGLVREIFGTQLSAPALDLVTEAVSRRWTSGRDLAFGLEQLGVRAIVKSASADAGRLADELFTLAQVVDGSIDLRAALSDPARSIEDKSALLKGLLDGKVLPATLRLAALALNGTHRTVATALTEYQKVAAEVRDQSVAKVRVARELSDADRARLGEALARQYGRAVHLNISVEPGLVGGMRVEIGDDVIDGSVASRLDDARRRLAG